VTGATRPPRADAQRNRERLLEVAVRVFTEEGAAATLDGIAKRAGVGIGTLYRHFPTREALIEAAYRNELTRLCESATDLLATMPPDKALRTWMDRFVDYMLTKHGMADALNSVIASGVNPYEHSRSRMVAALSALLAAGQSAGQLRGDVAADDVFAGIRGIALAAKDPAQREQAGRLLDLLYDGLRYRTPA
jgi:AcrR family transcriptional regulator